MYGYDVDVGKMASAHRALSRMDDWMRRELPELTPNYGQIEFASKLAALKRDAGLIVECISENMAAKVSLFRSLSEAGRRGAIFCTSTSGLSVSEMGKRSGFPKQFVGTHFWNPPHLMPLVEVVVGSKTTEETVGKVTQFCKRIGKRPIRVNTDAPGFIGNRLLHAMWREAIHIVEHGIASAENVDIVAKLTIGLRLSVLGPMEHMDLAGLDLVRNIHGYLLADLASNPKPAELLRRSVRKGWLGMKSGRGFHDWTKRDAAALIEAKDRQIVRELKWMITDGQSKQVQKVKSRKMNSAAE